jgi:hypothetical protein
MRRARVLRERVDHLLHGLDLLHDGVRRAIQNLRILGRHPLEELAPKPLCRELDRHEGIFDFVCETPRDLAPGGVALCLDQRGDVVEHQHQPPRMKIIAGQGGRATDQHLSAATAEQRDLFAPLQFLAASVLDHRVHQRL